MNNEENQHKRRVRYSGTHPKNFKEKYKELQPEKYSDTVAKIIQGGGTPAGMHIPICVNEILDFLSIKPGQVGLDATLGYGGHTQRMLQCLQHSGHLYAIDADPIELAKTRDRLLCKGYGPEIISISELNFADVDNLIPISGCFDFVLADLGLSSMQIDNPDRGFTYKHEGPLDLRLNPQKGESAAERLKHITLEELDGMLCENSDEPYSKEISKSIISHLQKGYSLTTTTELRQIIESALRFIPENSRRDAVKKSCQRTFQALRIDVNSEMEVLYAFLEKLPLILAPGGRVAILTFHSGEDRLVKKSFKRFFKEGIYKDISNEVIRPTSQECCMNSRAHSAKLRWAIKA